MIMATMTKGPGTYLRAHSQRTTCFFHFHPPPRLYPDLAFMSRHIKSTSDPRLEAEAFLLEPVIDFLRGYSRITKSRHALMNAEIVLQYEIDRLLVARERVLEAFTFTVESDSSTSRSPASSRHHRRRKLHYAEAEVDEDEYGDEPPRGRSRWRFGPPGTAPDYSARLTVAAATSSADENGECQKTHHASAAHYSQRRHTKVACCPSLHLSPTIKLSHIGHLCI